MATLAYKTMPKGTPRRNLVVRIVKVRRAKHFLNGLSPSAFDLGIFTTFHDDAIDGVARDFKTVGLSLCRHMNRMRLERPDLSLPRATCRGIEQGPKQLDLPLKCVSAAR